MSDTTNALAKEIEALRAKLGKAIDADAKAGTKALAAQQKKTAALRKKVAAATTCATSARGRQSTSDHSQQSQSRQIA